MYACWLKEDGRKPLINETHNRIPFQIRSVSHYGTCNIFFFTLAAHNPLLAAHCNFKYILDFKDCTTAIITYILKKKYF